MDERRASDEIVGLGAAILEALPCPISLIEPSAEGGVRVVWGNGARSALVGERRLAGDFPAVVETLNRAAARALRRGAERIDADLAFAEGRRTFDVEYRRFVHDGRTYVVALSVDVSEQRQAERQEQAAIESMVDLNEVVRRQLATELHDDAVQVLTAAALELQLLQRQAEQPDVVDVLGATQRSLSELNDRLRKVVFDLYPTSLATSRVADVLEERFGAELSRARVHLRTDDRLGEVPYEIKQALFRVAAEAIRNALEHASPQEVVARLARVDGRCLVQVCDDGSGFEAEAEAEAGHLGLYSMRATLEQLGGALVVTSQPGEGTTVDGSVPLVPGAFPGTVVPSDKRSVLAALGQLDHDLQQAWVDAPVGLVLADTAGTILRVNPAAAELHGVRTSDLVGTTVGGQIVPEDVEGLFALTDLRRSGEVHEPFTVVTALVRPDGSRRRVLLQAQVLRSPAGTPVGVLAVLSDVSRLGPSVDDLPAIAHLSSIAGAAVYVAVRDAAGDIVDFRCTDTTAADVASGVRSRVGQTMLETRPEYATDGFLEACIGAVERQETWRSRLFHDPFDDQPDVFDVQIVPLTDGIVLGWRSLLGADEPSG